MPAENEIELLKLAADGDRAAFTKLVTHYQSSIIAKATELLPPSLKHQAKDVAQDTFARVWKRLQHFKVNHPKGFAGWLILIATNLCRDRIRSLARRKEESFDGDVDSQVFLGGLELLFEGEEPDERLKIVGAVLNEIEYDCRILLISRFAYGLTPVDMAREAQETLRTATENRGYSASIQSWFQRFFDPLGKEIKNRRDHCLATFRARLSRQGTAISKRGTKKESRKSMAGAASSAKQ